MELFHHYKSRRHILINPFYTFTNWNIFESISIHSCIFPPQKVYFNCRQRLWNYFATVFHNFHIHPPVSPKWLSSLSFWFVVRLTLGAVTPNLLFSLPHYLIYFQHQQINVYWFQSILKVCPEIHLCLPPTCSALECCASSTLGLWGVFIVHPVFCCNCQRVFTEANPKAQLGYSVFCFCIHQLLLRAIIHLRRESTAQLCILICLWEILEFINCVSVFGRDAERQFLFVCVRLLGFDLPWNNLCAPHAVTALINNGMQWLYWGVEEIWH